MFRASRIRAGSAPERMTRLAAHWQAGLAMSSKLVPEAGQMIEDASVALANSLTPGKAPEMPQVPAPQQSWVVNE